MNLLLCMAVAVIGVASDKPPVPQSSPCTPVAVHKTKPNLPRNVRGTNSVITAEFVVSPQGKVQDAQITVGSGNREVDASIVAAVLQWKYKPRETMCGNSKVTATITIDYDAVLVRHRR